jgi:hypothetical protein
MITPGLSPSMFVCWDLFWISISGTVKGKIQIFPPEGREKIIGVRLRNNFNEILFKFPQMIRHPSCLFYWWPYFRWIV